MSAPTRGLAWVPVPLPGTTDRYGLERRDSYDGEERYRVSLDYDQACTVAWLLDEADGRDEVEAARDQRDQAQDERDDAVAEADELRSEIEDLKRELRETRDECERAENYAEDLRHQLESTDSQLANGG